MSGPEHLGTATRRTGKQRLMVVVGATISLILVALGSGLGYVNYRFGQIARFDVAIDVPPEAGEPRNYLIVGSDSRAGLDEDDPANAGFFDDEGTISADGAKRTDTIMVLRVEPGTGSASLLSLPRDLFVPIAGGDGRNRINVAFTRGREVLIDTIRQNFDIPIHHYVEIDFLGFLELVEAIGGVPFYFDTPVRDRESGLSVPEAGCISLEPRQSLSFARSRHLEYRDPDSGRWRTDGSGDLGRITRQQEFIRKAIAKAVSRGLSNPATLNSLVDVGVDNVGLDPTFTVRDILALGRRFASFDADTLATYSLPTTPFTTSAGAAVLGFEDREAQPILNVFRGLDPSDITPELVDVTVLNGTDTAQFAGDVTAALDEVGFVTEEPANSSEPFRRSTIFYNSSSENAATLLARHLTSSVEFVVDKDLDAGEVVLVAGDDFTTVHRQPSPTVPELPTTTTTDASDDDGFDGSVTPASPTTSTTVVGYLPGAGDGRGLAATCG